MRVVVAGGHGQVALLLERMLVERGVEAVGLVRNPDHVRDLEEVGAEGVVLDLERATTEELTTAVEGSDAVVFAAGAGPNSGAARKETVDLGAAVLLADAAEQAGVRRYVLVSAMGTDRVDLRSEPDGDDVMEVYLHAKAAAEDHLRRRDLDSTIVRPGRLTDVEGSGQVLAGTDVDYGDVPRADVAATLVSVLHTPETIGKEFSLVTGATPIKDALLALLNHPGRC